MLSFHLLLPPLRVVVIIAGVSSFIWCKRDIDKQRLALLKQEQLTRVKRRPPTIGNAARHN